MMSVRDFILDISENYHFEIVDGEVKLVKND